MTDKLLVKRVHEEIHDDGRFMISAMLTRFGDLAVFVYDWNEPNGMLIVWQGDNILNARQWLNSKLK